jgi:hypothetical protein
MRTLITAVASVVVVFAALGALDWSAHEAQTAPVGEVSVTQLPDSSEVAAYARAAPELTAGYRAAKSL